MKKVLKVFFALFCCVLIFGNMPSDKTFAITKEVECSAKSYIVIEEETGKVLYSKDSNVRLPMASITKVQSLNIVFEEIAKGNVKLEDLVVISNHSSSQKGSQAFLDEGKTYSVEDLIKTVVISSANDSCVALAEKISGTEKVFVQRMNKLASDMGLKNTRFANCTGMPTAEHYSSAEDITKMFSVLVKNDIFLKYSKIWMDELVHGSGRKTELVNTNRLIKTLTDCDAGKTGYTDEAKHCLVARAKRNGMNLIVALLGANESKERFENVTSLFNLGFANFEKKELLKEGEIVGEVLVRRGSEDKINAVASKSYVDVVQKNLNVELSKEVELKEKLLAPIQKGDIVGTIIIKDSNGKVIEEIPAVADNSVSKVRFGKIFKNINQEW